MSFTDKKWLRLSSTEGPDLKLFKARWDEMRNPRNSSIQRMIILQAPDSVNVVALSPAQTIPFVRQYRFGIQDYTLELPGGIIDEGEEVLTAAKRELREETGLQAENWQALGKVASNPVFMDSFIYHYLATNTQLKYELELDDGEDLEIVELPVEEVKQKLEAGAFQHPHTMSALVLFFAQR